MSKTYVIEGKWSGPKNPAGDWTKLQHREYTEKIDFAMECFALGRIKFSDGTFLFMEVREHRGPKDENISGYGELIRDCIRFKVKSVDDLYHAKDKADGP